MYFFDHLIIPTLRLLIFKLVILSITDTCLAQSLSWTCPASSGNESDSVHFPNIMFDQNSLENSVRDSPYLSDIGVYIYRLQPMITDSQCNGETFIQFCFENSENSTSIEMLVVLGRILFIEPDRSSLTGRILEQISINTTVECIPELSIDSLCCHSEKITITLTNETNAFAVQFPNQILLEYNGSQSMVETFVASRANVIGVGSNGLSIIQANGNFMDLNLRFIQVVINPQNTTTTNLPIPIIIISTVVPLGSLLIVLVIVATIIIGTQCHRKRRRKKVMNHLTGGDDLVLYNDGADRIDNNYDYAMVSGELIPPPITPDQEDPSDQQLYESVEFQASLKSDVDENDEVITEARPVSNSVNTGAEANARLSATGTVANKSEAHSANRSSSEAFGESIVVEKDVVYPAAIVNHNTPRDVLDGDSLLYVAPASDEHSLYRQFSKIKIQTLNKHTISTTDLMGSGQYGTVHKGEWMASEGGEKIEVAVKTLKERAGREDKVKFLQEAAIMGQFSHPNVVKLYGVVTERKLIMLILELLPKGDLQHVLRESKSMDADLPHTLLSYCRQIASGMSYLSSKLFIHRDLAARNILVSEDGACKIADFGMARDLSDTEYYISHGGKIPIKWTAPEAVYYKKYSTASDVWSFGCVMYEIWSLGHTPFEMHTSAECVKIVVVNGIRLAPPPGCPRVIYKLMMDCWHPESSSRPDFASTLQQLSLPDTKLLKWSEEDKATDPEAATLGAGLDKAENLYMDLQKQYNVHVCNNVV